MLRCNFLNSFNQSSGTREPLYDMPRKNRPSLGDKEELIIEEVSVVPNEISPVNTIEQIAGKLDIYLEIKDYIL